MVRLGGRIIMWKDFINKNTIPISIVIGSIIIAIAVSMSMPRYAVQLFGGSAVIMNTRTGEVVHYGVGLPVKSEIKQITPIYKSVETGAIP